MATIEPAQDLSNHVAHVMQLLEEKDSKELSLFLDGLHPVKLVATINSVDPAMQLVLIKHITGLDRLAEFVAYAPHNLRSLTLDLIDDARIAAVVRRLEVDDAADVVGILPRRRQTRVLRRLGAPTVKQLTSLLAYGHETAGGLMTPLFVTVPSDISVEEALQQIRIKLVAKEIDPDTDISYLYVSDAKGTLIGMCSLRGLLAADPQVEVSDLMEGSLVSVSPEDDQEVVARLIADYDLSSLPVIEPESGRMLGIVTVDDILDVIEEEHTEDMLRLAGTIDEDIVGASTFVAVKSRLPWRCASWLGGIVGSVLLHGYSSTLEKLLALSFFMPVVFGMGGNVGSQSSTITVRGLATGVLGRHRVSARLRKEAAVGISLGSVFGVLLGSTAYLLHGDSQLALIAGTSIMATMTCAASLGAVLPVLFESLGFDPAVASGPFVTTSTDILSTIIYFSIASILL